jgi:hypothetical protein
VERQTDTDPGDDALHQNRWIELLAREHQYRSAERLAAVE